MLSRSLDRLADRVIADSKRVIVTTIFISLSVSLFCSWSLVPDPDLFARLGMARLVEVLGYVPLQDPFSFTPKKSIWVDHEWLSGVVFLSFLRLFGEQGIFILRYLAIFVTTLLCVLIQKEVRRELSGFVLLLGLLSSSYLWMSTLRCQIFTYLFFLTELLLLLRFLRLQKWSSLLPIPLIFVLWVNLHGGALIGLIVLLFALFHACIYRLRSTVPLGLVLIASIVATGVNPYGFKEYWDYLFDALFMQRQSITEWSSPNIASGCLSIVFVLLLAVGVWKEGFRGRVFHVLVLAFSAYSASQHMRFLALFELSAITVGAPFLIVGIEVLSGLLGRWALLLKRSTALVVIGGFLLAFSFRIMNLGSSPFRFENSTLPIGVLEWLYKNSVEGGRLLVDFNRGSFALWRLYPRVLISLDGRYEEVYPESTNRIVSMALNPKAPGWEEAINTLDPDFVLITPDHNVEAREAFLNVYSSLYSDGGYMIVGKRERILPSPITDKNGSISIWEPRW